MRQQWLRQVEGAKNLIVFFSGWGFDTSIVQNLAIDKDTNVLFIDDYRSLDDELTNLEHYERRCLIAWSFGVAAYNAWQHSAQHSSKEKSDGKLLFDYTVAINGSMTPVNRRTGIPDIIMQKTIDALSVDSFQLFAQKCFDRLVFEKNKPFVIDVEARKQELVHIQQQQYPDTKLQWDKVWISQQDNIFPLRNLQRAWQDHGDRIELINAAHAPFHHWQNWQDILA